jgi:hypothetical protein
VTLLHFNSFTVVKIPAFDYRAFLRGMGQLEGCIPDWQQHPDTKGVGTDPQNLRAAFGSNTTNGVQDCVCLTSIGRQGSAPQAESQQ